MTAPPVALVLGATGQLGAACCRALAHAGYVVVGQSRALAPTPNVEGVALGWCVGAWQHCAEGIEGLAVIVDAAAPYPVDAFRRGGAAHGVIVADALRRADALIAFCRHRDVRLVAIGSFVSHLGPPAGTAARWLRRRHPYFTVKTALTQRYQEATLRGACVYLLDPTGFLGPYDRKDPRLSLVPRLARGDLPATLGDAVDFIDVRDVALAVVAALTHGRAGEPTLLSGHSAPFAHFVDLLCAALGVAAPRLRVPALAALPTAVALERALGVLGHASPFPTLALSIVHVCGAVPHSDQQRRLGVVPRPLADTVADTVAWYRSAAYGACVAAPSPSRRRP